MKILFSLFLMFIASSLSASVSGNYYGTPSSGATVSDSRTTSRDRTVRRIGDRSPLSERSAQSTSTDSSPSNYNKIATPISRPETSVALAKGSLSTRAVPVTANVFAVPEPSAIALMGLGLFGLVVLRRKAKS